MSIALEATVTAGGYGLEARVFLWVLSLCWRTQARVLEHDSMQQYGRAHYEARKGTAILRVRCDSYIVAAVAADTAGDNIDLGGFELYDQSTRCSRASLRTRNCTVPGRDCIMTTTEYCM